MRFQIVIMCAMAALALWAPPSCKEAPTTTPADAIIALTPRPPGYYYPRVIGFLPDTSPAPVNTEAAIIFNIPIIAPVADTDIRINSDNLGRDLDAGAGEYTLSVNDPANITIVTITFAYGGANPLAGGDTLTVSINNSIVDLERGIPLTGTETRTFTAGTEPDIAAPTVVAASRNPINPVTVELTDADRIALGQDIHVNFSEQMDPSSINNTTLILLDGAVQIPADVTYNSATLRATLTPRVNLDPATTYTVTVRGGGIPYQSVRDLSGNYLAADASWTFDTTATPLDITPGAPPFLLGLYVDSVSSNSSSISWSTNEPADYRLHFGRGDDMTRLDSSAVDNSFQSATLALNTVADDPNARYWFYVDFQDIEGQPIVNSATYQFNTLSTEAGTPVDSGAGNQHDAKTIAYHPLNPATPTGAFVFWTDDNSSAFNHLYGRLYNNAFGTAWSQNLFTENNQSYSYQAAAEDGIGGVIVAAQRTTGSVTYAKRIDNGGNHLWSYTDTSTGLAIYTSASSVSAVPVYTGMVQRRTTVSTDNTAEMGTYTNHANRLFDDNVSLTGVLNGDIIMDPANHNGTTAARVGGDNFNYMVGQTAPVFASPDTYRIGDAASADTVNPVASHTITATNPPPAAVPYTSGGTTFYTPHDYWTPLPAWLNNGDIVSGNGAFGLVTSCTQLTPILSIKNGTADGGTPSDLVVTGETWIGIEENDFVVNDDDSLLSTVTAPPWPADTLEMDAANPTNFDSGDQYHIYDLYCADHMAAINQFEPFHRIIVDLAIGITAGMTADLYDYKGITGTADAIPGNPLLDNQGAFSTPANNAQLNDIVVNFSTRQVATVNAAVTYNHALGLDAGIINNGNSYEIIRFPDGVTNASSILRASTTTSAGASHLIDTGVNFTAATAVVPGDIAYNLTDGLYAMVINVTANDLTLSVGAGFSTNNRRYLIIRQRGVLYVFQDGANVRGRVMAMDGSPPAQLRATFLIDAGTNPKAIADGNGNAIVVYTNGVQIRAAMLDCRGTAAWNGLVDTEIVTTKTLLDVQSDGAGGAVILYKYGNDLHAQRMNSAGTRQWGAGGRLFDNDGAATITSDEVMTYLGADVVVTATVNTATATNDIRTWRRGTTPWVRSVTALGTNQVRPKVFSNGTDLIIVWDDDRFFNQSYISTAYGVFGIRIRLTDGSPAGAAIDWNAAMSGTADYNGASVILNIYSQYPGYPILVPYNNSTEAALIWEDYRAGAGGDLLYLDNIQAFDPSL